MENLNEIFERQKEYYYSGHTLDISKRIRNLKKLKHIIKQNEKNIADAIRKDFGKSDFEVFVNEIAQVYDEINVHIKKTKKWASPKRRFPTLAMFPAKFRLLKEPYGVSLIIGPFNYPFSLLILPLVGSIAAGNCTILKPSELTPNTSKLMRKMINENFPKEFLYMCDPTGGKSVVQELLKLPFDYIFFTGSVPTGKVIMEEAAKHLTPVTLELGGKSPCIVTKEANVKMAAKRIAWGKLINAGQTCVAPDYVLVEKKVKDVFLKELADEIKKQYSVDAMHNKDFCGIINSGNMERLVSYLSEGTVYYGGRYDLVARRFEPTILTDVKDEAMVMKDEIFGPILPILEFDDLEEVVEEIKMKAKPLGLYVFSESKKEVGYVIKNISAGGAVANDAVIQAGYSGIPYGGVGNSGIGSYHGKENFETFSHQKTVVYRGTWFETDIRFAPYTDRKIKILRKFFS